MSFKREHKEADTNTKTFFHACFMMILPKMCQWWKQVVDCGTKPNVKWRVQCRMCHHEWRCFSAQQLKHMHAARMSVAKKPMISNKHKLENQDEDQPQNEKLKG